MVNQSTPTYSFLFGSISDSRSIIITAITIIAVGFLVSPVRAQRIEPDDAPIVVQPGAPGQPTRILPATTRAMLPALSPKDTEFMQGMIMHHGQAVEMIAFIESRTRNKELRLLGARISQSQSDEMNFMKRWLEGRKQPIAMPMKGMEAMMGDMDMSSHMDMSNQMLMPGMLSKEQMTALKKAGDAEFDRLFLSGMIQHHGGALKMVKELFDTTGAGQDAELFNFATDVDSGQRAEIKIMQSMLDKKPQKGKL